MKPQKDLYANLMVPLIFALICYLISLGVFYYRMEPKPFIYVFYPFLATMTTLVLYLASRWMFEKNNWIITAIGILFTITMFFKFHWNVI